MRQQLQIAFSAVLILLVVLGLWKSGLSPFHSAAAQPASEVPLPTGSVSSETGVGASERGASTIKTDVVRLGPIQKSLQLNGQVAWTETGRADVTSALNGIVQHPLVKVGDRVVAGQPLARINNVFGQTTLQLQKQLETDQTALLAAQNSLQQAITNLGQANATLASAQTTESQARDNCTQAASEQKRANTDLKRKKLLFEQGVYARADVEDAVERWEKARAVYADTTRSLGLARHQVDIARRNVLPVERNVKLAEKTVELAQRQVSHDREMALGAQNPNGSTAATSFDIKAPINGTVIALSMSAGQSVQPGAVLASVGDTTHVYVDAAAYESDLSGVTAGDPVEVTSPAFGGKTWRGIVKFVGTQVDATSRTVTVRCDVVNNGGLLRQGLFVTARVSASQPRQALLVPASAVLIVGADHYLVLETSAGHYERHKITEGAHADNQVEVVSGVKAGDKVVTSGNVLVMGE